MALPYSIKINGIEYFTMRGSITEQRGTGLVFALPYRWTALIDIPTLSQAQNLRACFSGMPVAVTFPKGDTYPRCIIRPEAMPAVITVPFRPYQIPITIEEFA